MVESKTTDRLIAILEAFKNDKSVTSVKIGWKEYADNGGTIHLPTVHLERG